MISLDNIQLGGDMRQIELVNFQTIRADTKDHFEAVVSKGNLPDLRSRLEKIFGPLKWPCEGGLSREIEEIINGFGGAREGQSLYYLKEMDYYVFAMLWPWQDQEHITLKIFRS